MGFSSVFDHKLGSYIIACFQDLANYDTEKLVLLSVAPLSPIKSGIKAVA